MGVNISATGSLTVGYDSCIRAIKGVIIFVKGDITQHSETNNVQLDIGYTV